MPRCSPTAFFAAARRGTEVSACRQLPFQIMAREFALLLKE